MNKETLWQSILDSNPLLKTDVNVVISTDELRRLFEETWDKAQENKPPVVVVYQPHCDVSYNKTPSPPSAWDQFWDAGGLGSSGGF